MVTAVMWLSRCPVWSNTLLAVRNIDEHALPLLVLNIMRCEAAVGVGLGRRDVLFNIWSMLISFEFHSVRSLNGLERNFENLHDLSNFKHQLKLRLKYFNS